MATGPSPASGPGEGTSRDRDPAWAPAAAPDRCAAGDSGTHALSAGPAAARGRAACLLGPQTRHVDRTRGPGGPWGLQSDWASGRLPRRPDTGTAAP